MNKKIVIGVTATLAATVLIGCATTMTDTDLGKKAEDIMRASFESKGQVSVERLNQDEVQKTCTTYSEKNVPPALAEKIQKAQMAAIMKPASGKLIGDWKAGEILAQEGRGMQFSDVDGGPVGGNCYACHQLTPQEISYGNIGPSLRNYGKLRGQSKEIVEYTYNKIYNSQAYAMCSNMPRFGHSKILTPEQIADVVGLLLDPASPVNQ
jgi:sulfur-oxidizing protein SoxX